MNLPDEPHTIEHAGALNRPVWKWLAPAALVAMVAVVYWPTLDNGFVNIDYRDLVDNPAVHSPDGLYDTWFKIGTYEGYYPLMYSTFWAEGQLTGLDPRGSHFINMALQALNVVLVWRLLTRLRVPGSWLAAAIFAVHPIEVQSVAFAIERKNLMSLGLVLGSMLAYLRFSPADDPDAAAIDVTPGKSRWLNYCCALGLYFLALLSKTVTVSMPAVLLVIYWWKRGRLSVCDVVRTIPFVVIGTTLSRITIRVERSLYSTGQEWNVLPIERCLIAGRAAWFYVGKLLWPYPMMFFYPRWVIDAHAWWQYLFPLAALALLAALWFARGRLGRAPLAAALIFGGVMIPALGFENIFYNLFSFVADHFQYHGGIALIAIAAASTVQLVRRLPRKFTFAATMLAACTLTALALMARERSALFKSNMTLMEDLARKDPRSWIAQYVMGVEFHRQHKYEEALSHFRRELEIGTKLADENPLMQDFMNNVAAFCYVEMGLSQRAMGHLHDSEDSFRKAIALREQLVRKLPSVLGHQVGLAAHFEDLALSQQASGAFVEAEASHGKAIQIRRELVRADPEQRDYQNGLAMSHVNLGLLQRDLGKLPDAQRSFRSAIDLRQRLVDDKYASNDDRDDLAWAYVDLALVQRPTASATDVEASYRKALSIRRQLAQSNPKIGKYQNLVAATYADIGLLLRDTGRPAEAETMFREAIQVRERLVREQPTTSEYAAGLAWCHHDLAIVQRQRGQLVEAEASFRKAIAIRQELCGGNCTDGGLLNDIALGYAELGLVQQAMGQFAAAEDSLRRSAELRGGLVQQFPAVADYPDGLAWCYLQLGDVLVSAHNPTAAEAAYQRSVEIRAKLVEQYPTAEGHQHQLAVSYRKIGDLLSGENKVAEALTAYEQAIRLRQLLAAEHPADAACQLNLAEDLVLGGDSLALLGRWTESMNLYAQAVGANNQSWQTMARLALLQLAAGNEVGYRATCAELVRRYGEQPPPAAAPLLALTLVVGDKALDDMGPAVALAERSVVGDASNPLSNIVLMAAQFRATHDDARRAALMQELTRFASGNPAAARDQAIVGNLVGQLCLAAASREHPQDLSYATALQHLQAWADQASGKPRSNDALPPWMEEFSKVIARLKLDQPIVPAAQLGS